MTDPYRPTSENTASQVNITNQEDVEVMPLAQASRLEQAVGKFVNQGGSLGKKMNVKTKLPKAIFKLSLPFSTDTVLPPKGQLFFNY